MWHEIKQFWSACTAVISVKDQEFLHQLLDENEYELFKRMDVPTQKHCIAVAVTALEMAESVELNQEDISILLKAALLHDIGKSLVKGGTPNKIIYVLVKKLAPQYLNRLVPVANPKGILQHFCLNLYFAHNHWRYGAEMARQAGLDTRIINLISTHHQFTDSPLARYLYEADSRN